MIFLPQKYTAHSGIARMPNFIKHESQFVTLVTQWNTIYEQDHLLASINDSRIPDYVFFFQFYIKMKNA